MTDLDLRFYSYTQTKFFFPLWPLNLQNTPGHFRFRLQKALYNFFDFFFLLIYCIFFHNSPQRKKKTIVKSKQSKLLFGVFETGCTLKILKSLHRNFFCKEIFVWIFFTTNWSATGFSFLNKFCKEKKNKLKNNGFFFVCLFDLVPLKEVPPSYIFLKNETTFNNIFNKHLALFLSIYTLQITFYYLFNSLYDVR